MWENNSEILYKDILLYMLAKDKDSNFGRRALYILVGPMLEAAAINISAERKFRFYSF